ncbi:MAG: cob(I)yrinic acid a,c-diamide adenosyltransferase [Candidatus Daviesbacteria bacterium]|nr:cob(I)yrinic acid a,c-diamide adenosyltransferase [Candidatus Daviesbacteria bacterium]
MSEEKGLVIIYTGEGKGKTTAALGLAVRAAGYNKKILVVQFGKNSFSGELKSLKKLNIKIIQGGAGFVKILGDKLPLKEHQKAARETFDTLYKEVTIGKWDLVVADEIIGAAAAGLLAESLVLKLMADKPENSDLVLTGHHVSKKLIEMADLVTEMKVVKHPYQQGILAKKGIDF